MEDPIEVTTATRTPRTRRRRALTGALAFATLLWLGVAYAGTADADTGTADVVAAADVQAQPGGGWGGPGWGSNEWSLEDLQSLYEQFRQFQQFQPYSGGQQATPTQPGYDGSTGGGSYAAATAANAEQSTGVVLIDTDLEYSGGEAAGTGMILTSDGYVLTNNHVIEGATQITVTDPSTNETYTATLEGTDSTNDVALLKLDNASGLATVTIDDDDTETVGDTVTAVGNASGGGVLMAATGQITELDASVTTSSTYYEDGETLTGTIEIQADVVAGDSGGALLDSEGEVIGMTTAASSGSAVTTAYAITIEDALAIVEQIQAGDESGTVSIGYSAFLGVGLAQSYGYGQTTTGATIGTVYEDTPAAKAGLVAGDTITAVNSTAVSSGDELATALKGFEPGDNVTITWTDASGDTHSTSVTLTEGPA
ncbi:S1C family serine protease [Demequina sp.]|uniref:S1C family serine protease n=1 Tax=Demequina sp. TaxID=2050685 RepID=UPI003D0B60D9